MIERSDSELYICRELSDSVIHMHGILFQILFPCESWHNIDCSLLCYAVGPGWSSGLHTVACVCVSPKRGSPLKNYVSTSSRQVSLQGWHLEALGALPWVDSDSAELRSDKSGGRGHLPLHDYAFEGIQWRLCPEVCNLVCKRNSDPSQRIGHDWETELNWSGRKAGIKPALRFRKQNSQGALWQVS